MSIGRVPGVTGIQPSIVDAKGDLIVATAADSVDRLAVGANNTVLTADSATATGLKWAALPASGKVLQVVNATHSTALTITSTSWTDTGLSASITPSAASSKILIMATHSYLIRGDGDSFGAGFRLLRGSTFLQGDNQASAPYVNAQIRATASSGSINPINNRATYTVTWLDSPNTTSSTTYKTQGGLQITSNNANLVVQELNAPSSIILMEIGA